MTLVAAGKRRYLLMVGDDNTSDVSPWLWSLRSKSKSLALIPQVLRLGLDGGPWPLALMVVLGPGLDGGPWSWP